MMKNDAKVKSQPRWRAALFILLTAGLTFAGESAGWLKAGSHPGDYDMGTDLRVVYSGKSSGYIRHKVTEPKGFGTYMQMFDAEEYRGKRLRLSAYIKSENVQDWAGLWMRVDRVRQVVAFDNMQNRPIKGTQTWTKHEIVLDVEPKATAIAFGILLAGKGAVWIDDLRFETVGPEVPITNIESSSSKKPRNLDFEDPPERL